MQPTIRSAPPPTDPQTKSLSSQYTHELLVIVAHHSDSTLRPQSSSITVILRPRPNGTSGIARIISPTHRSKPRVVSARYQPQSQQVATLGDNNTTTRRRVVTLKRALGSSPEATVSVALYRHQVPRVNCTP